MNKSIAAARLGLGSAADPISITRAYGEQLGKLQQQLVAANTDQQRHENQVQLAELVEAYEYLSQTGRYARSSSDEETQARPADESVTEAQPRESAIRLESGAVLSDRLEIGPMLGQGGMGYVYAARDRLKNENVAIKVLRQDLMFSTAAKERFLAEAKVSCNFSHPNIVNVYDVGVSGGNYYFSMELLKGQTLRQRMEKYHRDRRVFSLAEANAITRQLIDALRYAHRWIVHRDIKPENIWLEHDGTVKLMDFGIARANANSDMTQTGMTLGTAYYMAPEQHVAAKEVDWRADLYSLGIVLYELMVGTLPMGAARPLDELRRDLPKRYSRAVMRAIATRPEDRWASLQEFFDEINVRQGSTTPWVGISLASLVMIVAGSIGLYIYKHRDVATTARGDVQQGTMRQQVTADDGATSDKRDSDVIAKPAVLAPSLITGPVQGPTVTPGDSRGAANDVERVSRNVEQPADKPTASNAGDPEAHGNAASAGKPLSRGPTQAEVAGRARANELREECKSQCNRDHAECQSITRRGRTECVRAAAFATDASGGSLIRRRQECDLAARDADQRCLVQKQGCTAACQ